MGLFSDIGDFFGDVVGGATDLLGGLFGGGGGGGKGSGGDASALQQLGQIMTQTGQLLKPQAPQLFPSVRESDNRGSVRMGMPTSSQPIATSDPAKSLYLALYILSQMMNRPQEPLPGPPVGISPDYGYGPGFYTPMLRPPY